MDKIQIAAVWNGSRLELDREELRRLCQGLPIGRMVLTVQKYRDNRSNQANRRYWALLTVAASELGYDDPEDLHEGLAAKFLALPPDERTGLERRRRTPKLNTAEFAAYCETVERFLVMDLGVDLSAFYQEYAA